MSWSDHRGTHPAITAECGAIAAVKSSGKVLRENLADNAIQNFPHCLGPKLTSQDSLSVLISGSLVVCSLIGLALWAAGSR